VDEDQGEKPQMKTLSLILASCVLLYIGSSLPGQDDTSVSMSPWVGANVWGGMGGFHHASTAEEGALRGMADVTRSAGAANLMNSAAAKNWQDATRKYIENRQYGTETYFNMRDINRAAREAERGPRPTREDLVRYSQARMPDRLSVSDLDPLTGDIGWPTVLRDDQYGQYRQALETLYAQRAAAGGYLNEEQRAQVKQLTAGMQAELKANIRQYSANNYLQAKKFIEGLDFELYAPAS
jgi:hypothetical protein